jgi:hypothetical protein
MTGVLRPVLLLLLAALTGAACRPAAAPRSAEARLDALWRAYLRAYVRDSGEVVDPLRDGRVSSEAQSYAMVRAVWMRDRDTFERVDRWTARHLRREDGLHAWLWDPTAQRIVDANTATDGDVEIAFALAMASVVFERPEYATRARDIVLAPRPGSIVSIPRAAGPPWRLAAMRSSVRCWRPGPSLCRPISPCCDRMVV